MLLIRSGRVRGSVTVVGPAGEVRPEDVLALAPAVRERLAAAG